MASEAAVRRATLEDIGALNELYNQTDAIHARLQPDTFVPVENARGPEFIAGIIADKDAAVLVAEQSKKVVGMLHAAIRQTPDYPILVKRTYAHISDIIVREEHRGIGIGRILMAAVEKWALERGLSSIELMVWDANAGAASFYREIGYRDAAHTMSKKLT